jgi:hypothetical protein
MHDLVKSAAHTLAAPSSQEVDIYIVALKNQVDSLADDVAVMSTVAEGNSA